MIDLNATQAAIRAGYSVKNAASIRAQLLKKTHVSFSRASTERSWRGGITQDRVMQELACSQSFFTRQRARRFPTAFAWTSIWFWPLSLPQTAFTRLYSILRQNPESLENTGISLRAFTAFYTYYRIQILSSAPSKNLEAITVSRFFLFLVKTFLLRFGIVPSVGYIVGDIVVYFTDFVLQLTLLFIILSWAEDSSSSHEIDSVEYR